MIDTHIHLNFDPLAADVSGIIDRAREVGVSKFVIPATDVNTSESGVVLSRTHEGVFAAIGIHPSDAHEYTDEGREKLRGLTLSAVAIGEVGLDYYHTTEHVTEQKQVFSEMIALARESGLPLIIHTRDCFEDAYEILAREAKGIPTVIHCFSGSLEEAKQWLDLGFHLSFTGMITYKKNDLLREIVKLVPIERKMLETDGPFLAPEGFRGQVCEPRFVKNVAECVAEVKGVLLEDVDRITTKTAEAFFKI